jgi:hypothetical protein
LYPCGRELTLPSVRGLLSSCCGNNAPIFAGTELAEVFRCSGVKLSDKLGIYFTADELWHNVTEKLHLEAPSWRLSDVNVHEDDRSG